MSDQAEWSPGANWRPASLLNHLFRILLGAGLSLQFAACAGRTGFSRLYGHYFPKHSEYEGYYDRTMSGSPPAKLDASRYACTYRALHGDATAFHQFLHHPDQDLTGEPSEIWHHDFVLLVIRLGDARLAQLLALEDVETRERVGLFIESQEDWVRRHYPKTRALAK